jgi:tetratricopeptide (TPR) repeat protein
MKNNLILLVTIISAFSINCLAQKSNVPKSEKKITETYHVEENINMTFGGHTTNYIVSDKKLVNTYDLGPNNTRVVTQIIGEEAKEPINLPPPPLIKDTLKPVLVSNKIKTKNISIDNKDLKVNLTKSNGYAYVNMVKTYEKVAEKGYKSIEIFKKISNDFYFNDQLEKAAKWYGELFAMTTDLDSEYYYRYAHSLKSIGNTEKANEMMEKFNQLSEKENK